MEEKKGYSFWQMFAFITWAVVLMMGLGIGAEWISCGKVRCPDYVTWTEK